MLRRHRLDEMPQLFNVLRGELALVGPRPELSEFVEAFPEQFGRILSVAPGSGGSGLSAANAARSKSLTSRRRPVLRSARRHWSAAATSSSSVRVCACSDGRHLLRSDQRLR